MTLPPALAKFPADPVKVSGFLAATTPTISSCFGEFLRRVVPNHAAYAMAKGASTEVVEALRAELYPNGVGLNERSDHLIAGGVGKRTSLNPVHAVDVLYLLPPKLAAQKATDALKIVWAVLKNTCPGAAMSDTAVVVPRGALWVRIMPSREHGGAFLVPGGMVEQGGWSITNPVAEAATLRLSDSLYGGRPRLLLTALKAWRNHTQTPIESFVLELLAQEFYSSAPRPYELERALVEFWAWARRTPAALRPPGGQSVMVPGKEWHGKAKAAYWRATLADHHLKAGKVPEAAAEWRQVLGEAFPTLV